jgi:hypothetical protein
MPFFLIYGPATHSTFVLARALGIIGAINSVNRLRAVAMYAIRSYFLFFLKKETPQPT